MAKKSLSITFLLTHDAKMMEVNKAVFNQQYQTDVISLPMHDTMSDKEYLGEIIINQDQVKRNSEEFGQTYEQELARVVAHGVLHLLGHEDDSFEGKSAMKAVEDAVVEEIARTSNLS